MPHYNVSINAEGDGFHTAVTQLKEAGFQVEQELEILGVVSGSIAEGNRAALESIPGVSGVAADREAELPPIDSHIQ